MKHIYKARGIYLCSDCHVQMEHVEGTPINGGKYICPKCKTELIIGWG